MYKEFHQTAWNASLEDDWRELLRLAIREDLGEEMGEWRDLTARILVPEDARGRAAIVARADGVLAGERAVAITLGYDPRLQWHAAAQDGQAVVRGQAIGHIEGPARGLLAAERPMLNMLGHLSGIASLTRKFVEAVAGTSARIYDTRKTTPGWRRLEKYAVRCGGGCNHRSGLRGHILIKDNHLALGAALASGGAAGFSPGDAVLKARMYLASCMGVRLAERYIVEIEVDTLEQFDQALTGMPDLVLLDNFTPADLREAVARRNQGEVEKEFIELEASGGVDLASVRQIAESGVDRISVGALTHSAVALDFGLDWE